MPLRPYNLPNQGYFYIMISPRVLSMPSFWKINSHSKTVLPVCLVESPQGSGFGSSGKLPSGKLPREAGDHKGWQERTRAIACLGKQQKFGTTQGQTRHYATVTAFRAQPSCAGSNHTADSWNNSFGEGRGRSPLSPLLLTTGYFSLPQTIPGL